METKGVKVSIIIPVYNVAPYIGECLQSVMQQSYKGDVECILVDDCGLDESIVIAEQMIKEYNENEGRRTKDDNVRGRIRFRILHHERNRGNGFERFEDAWRNKFGDYFGKASVDREGEFGRDATDV